MNAILRSHDGPTLLPRRLVVSRSAALSGRGQIEILDAGLSGVEGARAAIKEILSRKFVTTLILGHNDLGDSGCEVLFDFLRSESGRRYSVSIISLNSNHISDRGLLSIAKFLEGNTTLKELFLQNNRFAGDPEVINMFTTALNTSRLSLLSLTTNSHLSDAFIAQFLATLDSPHLQEIQLSVVGITRRSAPVIARFIVSSLCRLNVLKMNGNSLGLRGARTIIRALYRRNFTLTKLEIYANLLTSRDTEDLSSTSSDEEDANDKSARENGPARDKTALWLETERVLKKALARNEHLKRETEREALALLRGARATLLRPRSPLMMEPGQPEPSLDHLFASIGISPDLSPRGTAFPFALLPPELQLHVLSFLAPILTPAQRLRVCAYASDARTLPSLLPSVTRDYYSDPSPGMTAFLAGHGTGLPVCTTIRRRPITSSSEGAEAGRAPAASSSAKERKAEERAQFLAEVKCDVFETESEEPWSEDDVWMEVLTASGRAEGAEAFGTRETMQSIRRA